MPALDFLGVQRERVPDRPLERFDGQARLAQVVGGAGLHRLDGDLLGSAAGQHDDRRLDPLLTNLAQQAQAVASAEPVVEEGDIESLVRKRAKRGVVVDRDAHIGSRPALAGANEVLDHPRVLGHIVDDKESEGLSHRASGPTAVERCRRSYRQARGKIRRSPAMRAV